MSLPANSPMIRVLVAHLGFEVIVYLLAIAGMIQVSGLAPSVAFLVGGGAAALALVAAAVLRRGGVGWVLGWLAQVAGVALGFATPMMFAVGGIFAGLWVVILFLGRSIEQRRAGD